MSAGRRWAPAAPAALVALALVAGACGGGDGDESLPSETTAPIVDPSGPAGTVTPAVPAQSVRTVAGVEVGLEEVTSLDAPIAAANRPGVDDGFYLAERRGVVRWLDLATGATEVVVDISDQTSTDVERGLLGLAVDPAGEHLYLSSTSLDGDTRVTEYVIADDGSVDEGSRRVVFALDQPFPNHNGGHITFGPDGMLYLGLGDGGVGGDPLRAGQDREQLLGSLLRIDPRGVDGSAYTIPSDNPYAGEPDARPEVWLKGVRNPWRFAFDPATGDLWIGDVGQEEVEEVTWLPADDDGTGAGRGANLGWNQMEGDQPYEDGVEPADHTPPVLTYGHEDGACSVTGGIVYRGTAIPELAGAYLFADNCLDRVEAVAFDREAGEVLDQTTVASGASLPVSFHAGPDGEAYVLSLAGPVLALTPA